MTIRGAGQGGEAMKTLTEVVRTFDTPFWGPENCDWRWAQRWARAHKVRKAGRDYRFNDQQVKQMADDYASRAKAVKR